MRRNSPTLAFPSAVILAVLLPAALLCGAPYDWTCPRPEGKPNKGVYFSVEERTRLFPKPEYSPDFSRVDRARVHRAPSPGIHPRVYITPTDLPAIRTRIKRSKAAALAYRKLCDETVDFFHEGDEAETGKVNVVHTKPEVGGAGAAALALHDVPKTQFRKTPIQKLVDGTGTSALLRATGTGRDDHVRIGLTRPLALNALRALVDDDTRRGRRVAAALTHYAKLCQEQMAGGGSIGAYRPVHYLTLAYDYAAPFMTDPQRCEVRKTIAMGLTNPLRHLDGAMYGVGHPRPSHNWVSLVTQYILMLALAIEGEDPGIDDIAPGYVDQAIAAMTETSERWIHTFWGKNGCSFEGMGKCQLNAAHYVALARRGNWLICHPHVRRAIDSFYPAIMQPDGYKVTVHSGWGGSGNPLRLGDVLPLKWLAPDDPVVDFVYRNAVLDDYSRIEPLDLVFAVDWTGPADWREHAAAAQAPVNYLDAGRAMLCARSSWDRSAAWLQFICDQQRTAHMQMEIGSFLLTSHGRPWAQFIRANDSVGASSYHNVLLIDGVEQEGLGRMVAVGQSDGACFATADWAPAYNRFVTDRDRSPTLNDFRPLTPIKAPYADMKDAIDWRNGWLKHPVPADWEATPVCDVTHAFRTVGMVRGPRPYVLVIDDVQKPPSAAGQAVHLYEWFMQTPNDVVVASMSNREIAEFAFLDIVLASENDVTGDGFMGHKQIRDRAPVLLVRLLKINTDRKHHVPLPGVLETWNNVPSWPNTELKPIGKRLKIQTWAVKPDFRILLYPHRHGEPMPKTTWENNHQRLRVVFPDQMDEFDFTYLPGGRPTFTLKHVVPQERKEETFRFGVEVDALDGILDTQDEELF